MLKLGIASFQKQSLEGGKFSRAYSLDDDSPNDILFTNYLVYRVYQNLNGMTFVKNV